MFRAVATARSVTPAHPTSASSNMSAEHALLSIAAGRRVKPGFDARFSGFDFAGDIFADSPLCAQSNQSGFRTLSILRFERCLQ